MTVTNAIAAACAVLIVMLVWFMVRLQRQVRQLSSELTDLRESLQHESASSAAEQITEPPESDFEPEPEPEHEPAAAFEAPAMGLAEQPEQVSVITAIPEPEDDLTTVRIASVALGGPLIKVAAFSHGVRRALDEEQRMRISYAVRKELRRQRKIRRRRRSQRAPSEGWRP